MSSPATAAALAVVVVLLAAALVPLSLLARQNVLSNVGSNAVFLPMAAVGLVVARRQPGNPIGWLLLAAPAGQLLSAHHTERSIRTRPRPSGRLPASSTIWASSHSPDASG